MFTGSPVSADSYTASIIFISFTASSGTISVGGAFTHSAGTFTHNNGTVILRSSGNQVLTLLPSTTFYDLVIGDDNDLDQGLVVYYSFDEAAGPTAFDLSGNGMEVKIINGKSTV